MTGPADGPTESGPEDQSPADRDLRCQGCGVAPDPDSATGNNGPIWMWSISTDAPRAGSGPARRVALCPRCTQANTRNIEARLDEDWW